MEKEGVGDNSLGDILPVGPNDDSTDCSTPGCTTDDPSGRKGSETTRELNG